LYPQPKVVSGSGGPAASREETVMAEAGVSARLAAAVNVKKVAGSGRNGVRPGGSVKKQRAASAKRESVAPNHEIATA
jgi:hypothetical protein